MRRAFVIVLDACGVGALPDAASYGDLGSDTLGHLSAAVGGLRLPTLQALGLGNVIALAGVAPTADPVGHGRLAAIGPGKDSTAGHWGLMGVSVGEPPVYPEGFPDEVIAVVSRVSGRGVLGNHPCNGLEAIERYGPPHLLSGDPIVYTSQDSVLQIAAHVDVLAPDALYEICARVRTALPCAHAVGRVIARPFAGDAEGFRRTDGRRDFALAPRGGSYLTELQAAGVPTHGVGKVVSLFAGTGFDTAHPGATNARALEETGALIASLDRGLVFTNLVETTRSTAIAMTAWALPVPWRRSTATSRAGCRAWASRTCSCSPPITAVTRPAHIPTTRASTRRCWRATRVTARGATTARWPTSARASLTGWPIVRRPSFRVRAFSDPGDPGDSRGAWGAW